MEFLRRSQHKSAIRAALGGAGTDLVVLMQGMAELRQGARTAAEVRAIAARFLDSVRAGGRWPPTRLSESPAAPPRGTWARRGPALAGRYLLRGIFNIAPQHTGGAVRVSRRAGSASEVRMSHRRRDVSEPVSPARLSWEQAARDFPALLARVHAGETVLLADGDRVVAQIAPPPAIDAGRPPRRRPVFGALRGAGTLPDSFFDPLPEAELRAWEGESAADPSIGRGLAGNEARG